MSKLSETTPAPTAILSIEQLQIAYHAKSCKVRAIDMASLRIVPGEAVGLVGE